ncbi:MAG TPA: Uma2 family endonuclease [Vicinamibacteria bacterium]|nr:Uma2 family endonuclease [Vicinamibacteria bacterium]
MAFGLSPTGAKTGWRNAKLNQRLANWADENGRGIASTPTPASPSPRAKRSPDAAWVRLEAWEALTDEEQERFAPIRPDFVSELRSPQDDLAHLQAKMTE